MNQASVSALREGDVLGQKYTVVRHLGRGGMGSVYEARNALGRRFALKVLLHPKIAEDHRLIARFFREARASATIESDHIVEVYDTETDARTGLPFIVMELLRGEDLEQTLSRVGALQPTTAVRIIVQAATGLAKAHGLGIIHRDIKPANIFIAHGDEGNAIVKLLDFGVAKESMELLSQAGMSGLTRTGTLLGTPSFMAPEQARSAKHIDARADVWSLGVCLYNALTDRLPWGDVPSLGALVMRICAGAPTPIQDLAPWVPPQLAHAVHRALARDLDARTPNVRALIDDLRPFCDGAPQISAAMIAGVGETERRSEAVRIELPPGDTQPDSKLLELAGTLDAESVAAGTTPTRRRGRVVLALSGAVIVAASGTWAALHKGTNQVAGTQTSITSTSESVSAPTVPASIDSSVPPPDSTPPGADVVPANSATLRIHMPAGASVTINNEPTTVVDGGLVLTGPVNKPFFVSIWKDKKALLTQKVVMKERAVVPAELGVPGARGVQTPLGASGGAK